MTTERDEVTDTQTFEAVARDKGGDWIVMNCDSSLSGARTRIVLEAGFMVQGGNYTVVGLNRAHIMVRRNDGHWTEFKVRQAE